MLPLLSAFLELYLNKLVFGWYLDLFYREPVSVIK